MFCMVTLFVLEKKSQYILWYYFKIAKIVFFNKNEEFRLLRQDQFYHKLAFLSLVKIITDVLTQMYFIFFVGKCCPAAMCNSESTV